MSNLIGVRALAMLMCFIIATSSEHVQTLSRLQGAREKLIGLGMRLRPEEAQHGW